MGAVLMGHSDHRIRNAVSDSGKAVIVGRLCCAERRGARVSGGVKTFDIILKLGSGKSIFMGVRDMVVVVVVVVGGGGGGGGGGRGGGGGGIIMLKCDNYVKCPKAAVSIVPLILYC